MHECLDEPDLLAVPLRELSDRSLEVHLQAFAEHVARPCVDRAAQSGERVELLATGESIAQSEIARQIPDVATRGDAVRMRIAAEDRRTARGRMDEPEEEADRRRL